ncbi:MgtC/SapB family protein [Parabacteroides sp. 52]|uniref:MgtC/SapB family protein n=1 Tax=unclassified Parabacteroides TaxID=2649774 RepID=UPI0013CF866C|nr:MULTISPECIES: MgtC/SapB family protein [unclassified Parabacteroides]NDV54230.1 MgtC/SapB family protein [Parabacteroides sp. 52]
MLEELIIILESTEITLYTAAVRLGISFILGAIIGVERQLRRRDAGMRTFSLICMGSTAAMLISIWIPQIYPNFLNGDPGRIAAQVLTGIGFLGAGAIIQSKGSVQGLTTAACIWVIAVIGLAVGSGMYGAAIITTFAALFVLLSMEKLEKRMFLDGVNKILVITCSTSAPELKKIRKIVEDKNIYIVSFSYENDYEKQQSVITYKVNVKQKSAYSVLFSEIQSLGYVTQIRLLA